VISPFVAGRNSPSNPTPDTSQKTRNRSSARDLQVPRPVLSLEAIQAIRQLRLAGCPGEERARLAALVRALRTLVTRVAELVSRRELLREIADPRLRRRHHRRTLRA
jgi:hypothetical protein